MARWSIVFALCGLLSVAFAQPAGKALEQHKGKVVPDVTFVDINGKAHKLSTYRGKVLLLNFWSVY